MKGMVCLEQNKNTKSIFEAKSIKSTILELLISHKQKRKTNMLHEAEEIDT